MPVISPARQRQHTKRRRRRLRNVIRRFVKRDHTSPKILALAALTGGLAGAICAAFEFVADYLIAQRFDFLDQFEGWTLWLLAFAISALLGGVAMYLTHRFAPEAGGSGIPEIEGALDELRPVRWWRVIPVKFFGGSLALSSGMILGREGPSVQIGGNVGRMVADLFKLPKDAGHALLAAGSAAGLSAAFNAPLAGILFVLEEMRPQFRYSFLSVKAVSTAVILATVTRQLLLGTQPVFHLPQFETPHLSTGGLYVLLGCLMGVMGYGFNRAVNRVQDTYLALHRNQRSRVVALLMLVAGGFGVLSLYGQGFSGSGMHEIPVWITSPLPYEALLLLLLWRLAGTLLCFCSGIPGGVFAPSLALGTLCGAMLGQLFSQLFPGLPIETGTFAIAGMGALFAASVRAPVTGIVLVTEMTNNYGLILPMMITTLCATLVAQMLGGRPIYSQILERTLRLARQKTAAEAGQPVAAANT
ncbi:MAG: H(+)/Cl(-) exchange transporter ClcA [Aeromonadaceae bacterium]|nr:H(+)/Cl(-) exchange transporter ClcA [Aeromonadaceae bacterium]